MSDKPIIIKIEGYEWVYANGLDRITSDGTKFIEYSAYERVCKERDDYMSQLAGLEEQSAKNINYLKFKLEAATPVESQRDNLSAWADLYQTWIDANGSRSPSVRDALAWMFDKLYSRQKSGEDNG